MTARYLRGKGPLMAFRDIWNSSKTYLGLIVGFHNSHDTTVYGKITQCHEVSPDLIHATVTHKNGTTTHHHFAPDTPMRILTQRTCPWCSTTFFPRHQDQRYCQPDHESAHTTKQRATRKLLQQVCLRLGITCLHPTKKRYFSRQEAQTAAKHSRRRYGTKLAPYLCVCERWHLGHASKTPAWLGCGTLDPTVERIGAFLGAHGVDVETARFFEAAYAGLDWYETEAPRELLDLNAEASAADRCP